MNTFSTSPDNITNDIVALMNEFVSVWNQKDAQLLGGLFTEDAEFTDIVRQVAQGRAAIIEQHIFPFNVTNKVAVLSVDELHIRTIAPDMVLTSCNWQVENSNTPKGDILPPRKGVMQVICKQSDNGWKISLVHNTDAAQAYNEHVDTTLRLFTGK